MHLQLQYVKLAILCTVITGLGLVVFFFFGWWGGGLGVGLLGG